LAAHKLRSIGASILLAILVALLLFYLLPGQYNVALNTYLGQGQRAYVLAFIDLFLNSLFSSGVIMIVLPTTFVLSVLLLRSWEDGLLTGLSTGLLVSLLSLYMLKNYFPGTLASGGLSLVLEKLWVGIINGLAVGLVSALGGSITGKIISRRIRTNLTSSETEKKFYKCPRCGVEFESNPKICSNCGKKIK
jgi:hypothetical protein